LLTALKSILLRYKLKYEYLSSTVKNAALAIVTKNEDLIELKKEDELECLRLVKESLCPSSVILNG
jgi:hypothetical protein